MTLRAVIGSIRVLVSYDMPTRYRLYRLLQADLQFYSKSIGRRASRLEYHSHMIAVISEHLSALGVKVVDERGVEFYRNDNDAVEPETIRNFLAIKLPTDGASVEDSPSETRSNPDRTLAGVATKTMQFVDLFCQAAYPNNQMHPRTGGFLDKLGRFTATQYRSEMSAVDPGQRALLGSRKIFLARVDDINIISPLKINALLVCLHPASDSAFAVVQVFALTRWKGDIGAIFRESKREWCQEHYGGIGVLTRDGLSCHLNSKSLHVPLYGLFRLAADLGGTNPNEFALRFFDYSEEVKEFGNVTAEYLQDRRIEQIVDNIGWYI